MANDGDIVAQEPKKRELEIPDEEVHLDNMWLQSLFAAKGEQLAREIRRATRGLADLRDMARHCAVRADLGQDQIAVAENRGQKIIKIVRHATGELSESFEAFRLAEPFPEEFAFGFGSAKSSSRR